MAKKKTESRNEYDVTPEQFIEAWQTSNSADEVSRKLKMPKPIVHARASSYRHAGIKLKKMPRRSTRGLDVEALNSLIERLGGSHAKSDDDESVPRKGRTTVNRETVRSVVEDVVGSLHAKAKR